MNLRRAEGRLLEAGDETLNSHWAPIEQIAQWMARDSGQFDWVDQAGLLFYLKHTKPNFQKGE